MYSSLFNIHPLEIKYLRSAKLKNHRNDFTLFSEAMQMTDGYSGFPFSWINWVSDSICVCKVPEQRPKSLLIHLKLYKIVFYKKMITRSCPITVGRGVSKWKFLHWWVIYRFRYFLINLSAQFIVTHVKKLRRRIIHLMNLLSQVFLAILVNHVSYNH